MKRLYTRILSISLLLVTGNLDAAQFRQWGEYRIHYTTFASTVIPAEVAELHNIVRSEDRIIINISVKKGDEPVRTKIEGTVLNLLEQRVSLEFTEVLEQDAIYYLASHKVNEKDILRFSLLISPSDAPDLAPYQLSYLRRYQ